MRKSIWHEMTRWQRARVLLAVSRALVFAVIPAMVAQALK
jgi:hypothetical protein